MFINILQKIKQPSTRVLLISILLCIIHSSWAQNMYSSFGKNSSIRKEHTATAKPPKLDQPLQDEQIAFEKPLNITFKWSPRYQDGTDIEYEFILKELPDNIISPKTAYTRGIEIFRTTTRRTMLHYSHLEPALQPNKRYGWQVKVVGYDILHFENNGFSEIGWFTINSICSAPKNLNHQITLAQAQLSWSATSSETKSYIVIYRQKPKSPNNQWNTIRVYGENTILSGLKSGKDYQWRVGTICEGGKPLFSTIQEFMVPELVVEKSKIAPISKLKNSNHQQQDSAQLKGATITDSKKDSSTIKNEQQPTIDRYTTIQQAKIEESKDSKTALKIKPAESGLSGAFAKQKGSLPIPVTGKYSIVTGFGKHQQSKYITTNSNGIDIQTQAGANACAVFDGEVSNIISFPGFNTCVIIRHGNYYTFYGNLRIVKVQQGQSVKVGQTIGSIFTNPESGITKLHFQLWNRTNKQNPMFWLKR